MLFRSGLSYSTFAYANARVARPTLRLDGKVEVLVDVTNKGERDGQEVVQLYIRQPVASRSRPLRELGEAPNAPRDRVEDLRDEARVRLARYQRERPTDRVPKFLVQLNPKQKHALIVDTRESTLYVYENRNGEPHYVAD